MKKRIIGLALVIGVVLSLCASAGATVKHSVASTFVEYTGIHKVSSRVGKTKSIKLAVDVAVWTESDGTYSDNAAKVKFSISPADVLTDATITPTEFTLSDSINTSAVAMLVGTIAKTGTITVTAQLLDSEGKNCTGTSNSGTATIVFDDEDAADTTANNFPASGQTVGPYTDVPKYDEDSGNALYDTVADPNSDNWNGLDPTFGTKGANAKKEKPKITTSKFEFTKTTDSKKKALTAGISEDFKVEIKGPAPQIDVYVAAKDAIKLGWLGKGAADNIRLDSKDIKKYAIPFRVISYDISKTAAASQDKDTTHSVTIAYNGAHVAYKGFPLTVAVENGSTTKAVTKTYKIDINGRSTPQWVDESGKAGDAYNKNVNSTDVNGIWTKKNAADIPICFTDGETTSKYLTVSADAPYTVDVKGNKDGVTVTATGVNPTLNRWGEVVYPGYAIVAGSFTETDKNAGKEQKAAFTVTATGNVKKTSAKATVIGKVSPYFDSKKITTKTVSVDSEGNPVDADDDNADDTATLTYLTGIKRVEAGKVPSIKFAAKGSKTIAYELLSSATDLTSHGLSFDAKKGAVIARDSKNKAAITPTLDDTGSAFQSMDIGVRAYNDVGSTEAWAEVAITGPKPKFKTKTIVISRDQLVGQEDGTVLDNYPIELSNVVDSDDNVIYDFVADKDKTALSAVGLTIANKEGPEGYLKILSSKDIKATKGAKTNINASYYGAVNKGGITVVIVDPAPEISGDSTIAFTSLSKDATGKTIKLGLVEDPTGDTKLAWKLKTKPTNRDVAAKLTAARDGKSATLNVTIKKDLTTTLSDSAVITVTNAAVKPNLVDEFTVTITAVKSSTSTTSSDVGSSSFHAAVIDENAAAPEAEAEDDEESAEPTLTFGKPRTAANITAAQQAFLQSKGYTVIAVLPEVTADKDGQAEVAVELIEDAPEGAKLVYVPFPKNAAETDDDKIADFFDEEGAAIETVPAEKNITVAPWFRAGVTYEPVIAAEK